MNTAQTLAALRALAHESRLAAFRALVEAGHEGLAVGALRERLQLPPATLTAHLNVLRAAGLVADAREGRSIRVRADYARMDALIGYL
ncbi:MAG TPA: metalloregulator ArsR/SmtB family transcription factor, partial [Xanthomonadaceae bacterium]|nr:metalloregulator ArsR/SmtB family transcription factor [Xanthomonadaceae bacterium]